MSANGRSLPEVIVTFQDGQSYSKTRLDELARGGFFEKTTVKPAPKPSVKKEDVDVIVRELEITRAEAEKVLQQHNGDLAGALRTLVCAP
ncbi:hypothetical protein BKA62DRAFT_683871 [Auriculariales sp. MPI-PUGE-AT-0066]|nr:hypothetical protein BKA62DRAFT_683871 [Auriculariales sp. MPI-PUGE-AT-0066]